MAAWPVTVMITNLQRRKPRQPRAEHRRANVQGGTHVGGGRSLGPRRDAEAFLDDGPNASSLSVVLRGISPLGL
jgi:hypothetical protein